MSTEAPEQHQLPIYFRLSAEELVEKSICPVKKEFVRTKKPTGSVEKPKQQSKKQQQKQAANKRKANLCNTFVQTGACQYGDSCKFSHDYAAFVAVKEDDLPGLCPFEARSDDPCPYGVGCRWATKHRVVPAAMTEALAALKAQEAGQAQEGQEDVGAAGPSTPSPLMICGDIEVTGEDGSVPPVDQRPVALYTAASTERVSVASIREELNECRDAKDALARHRYDLGKAVTFLKTLGVHCKYGNKKDKKGGDRKKQDAAAAAAAAVVKTEEGAGDEAAAKKAKVQEGDVSTAAAVTAITAAELVEGGVKGSVAVAPPAAPEAEVAPYKETLLKPEEVKRVDFKGKTYLAPLTTNGNLPFRRLAVQLGCDITCSEMAMATNILQGHRSEFALLKRHPSEKIFGIQVCGGYADSMGQCAQVLAESVECDFVDINSGCPIDLVCHKGGGSSLLKTPNKVETICKSMSGLLNCPLTLKVRKGYELGHDTVHNWLPRVHSWGVQAVTVHGRTREQRYSKLADWEYIAKCASVTQVPLIGNGDIYTYHEYNEHMASGNLSTVMCGRGALIKPWLFTEIKEQRDWDISASERLELYKDYCRYGLDHWGSDERGVETTRRFLLEMMSFTHRYVPVGILESIEHAKMHLRPPTIYGRNQLETWLASDSGDDWLRLSEMLLGPAPEGFVFVPKHRSNSYSVTDKDMLSATAAVDDGVENG